MIDPKDKIPTYEESANYAMEKQSQSGKVPSCIACNSKDTYEVTIRNNTPCTLFYYHKNGFMCKRCYKDLVAFQDFTMRFIIPILKFRRLIGSGK